MSFTRRTFLHSSAVALPAFTGTACLQTASRTSSVRTVTQVVYGTPHVDGAGVSLVKLLGGRALSMLDPFLMLDGFHSRDPRDYQAGFPMHPHRGFETVTIMLDGSVSHKDSLGNNGLITGGGLQWMTAGRGIVHEEFPKASPTSGDMWGFQLWVNLPAKEKWQKPRYQDMAPSTVPVVAMDEGEARILAGRMGNVRGPIDGITMSPLVLDVRIPAGGRVRHDVAGDHNAFFVIVDGEGGVNRNQFYPRDTLLVLGKGDTVELYASPKGESRLLLFAGKPIGEPVARRGPFVMNTDAEIQQAFADYRSGRLAGG